MRVFENSSFLSLLFLTLTAFLGLQEINAQEISYFAQMNTIVSKGDNAPFWLVANRQGLSSLDSSNGYARYGMKIDGSIGKENVWKYSAGIDLSAGYNMERSVSVNQLYAEASWKWLTLSLGMKHRSGEMRGFSDVKYCSSSEGEIRKPDFPHLYRSILSDIGSGGLLFSGNSSPIPQFRVEVPEFVSIFGRDTWIKLRGHIAYGMFLDHNFQEDFTAKNPNARYAKKVMYHSKALFMKFGKPEKFPLEVEGGLEMYSQFGGDFYTHSKGKYMSMPGGVKDFFKAFVPGSGDGSTPGPEQANMSGNHIGNWHLALTLHTKPLDIRVYGEHMFEDFSQLFFFEYQSNREGKKEIVYYPWRDIQLGISVKNKSGYLKFISNVCYEYMSTYDQSGAGYNDPGPNYSEQMDGCDDYYNHSIYPGWHNYGMGIGNPLVFSPLYNNNGSLVFSGNRLKSHHFGMNGSFGNKHLFLYRMMYTYSENWGTYFNPFNEKKYTTSMSADIVYTPCKSNWMFSLSLALDKSNLIGNNWGAMVSIARIGVIK